MHILMNNINRYTVPNRTPLIDLFLIIFLRIFKILIYFLYLNEVYIWLINLAKPEYTNLTLFLF